MSFAGRLSLILEHTDEFHGRDEILDELNTYGSYDTRAGIKIKRDGDKYNIYFEGRLVKTTKNINLAIKFTHAYYWDVEGYYCGPIKPIHKPMTVYKYTNKISPIPGFTSTKPLGHWRKSKYLLKIDLIPTGHKLKEAMVLDGRQGKGYFVALPGLPTAFVEPGGEGCIIVLEPMHQTVIDPKSISHTDDY